MDQAKERQQIARQCAAVSELARILARIFDGNAALMAGDHQETIDTVNTLGFQSAQIMEDLGDILNGLSAGPPNSSASLSAVFEEAQRRYPAPPHHRRP